MANRTLNTRLRLKYDTAANWVTKNPVLLAGEVGIESDTLLGKVGDGEKTWQQLEYLKAGSGAVRFDIAQTLTDDQKIQARANIDAAKSNHAHNYAGSNSPGGAATSANKVNSNLIVKLNSGATEGTNLFTFNGSAAKTINITPSAIGAAPSSHGIHVTTDTVKSALGIGSGTSKYLREDGTWQIPSDTHYTNYLQIKGNNTEAVKFTQNADKTLNFKPGTNVSISAAANEITISATNTNTATAADNILDGSNSGTEITYKPYTSQQSKLSFDTSTTNPTRTDRLNLNGYLYATKLYSGGKEVFTSHQSIKSINTNNTAAQTVNANEAIAGSGTINLHKVSKTGSYNDLSNIPVINQDLTVSGFTPVANTYYKHTGSTTSAYIKGRMYYCDGTNLKKVVIVDELPPAPNNGKLTITVNGTAHTFTANQAGDTSFSITDTDTGATSVEVTGAGNAVTSASYNPSTRKLTLTKEIDFMPKSGGTFTGEVTFNKKINLGQGDANCLYLGSDGRLNGPENRMLFGLVNDVTTFGHTAYPLEFRGNGTHPRFNGFDLALKLDIPDNSKHGYTKLTDEDLNTIKDTGWYRAMDGNTCTNRPSDITSGIPFVLEVERTATSFIKQTLYQMNLGTYTFYMSFVRYSSNSGSTWVSWIKQQTMSDDYSQTFSGHKNFSDGINIKNSLEIEGSSGTSGQVLTSQGVNKTPIWATPNADTGATSVGVTGAGNAVTTASYDPQTRKLTLTRETTFLTHQNIKSINTNNTAAQTVNVSEAITGSGTINLHKVSKTGNYNDLLNKPTIPDISGKLDKTTYEWNKEFRAGSNGAISLGRYNIYDTQLTFDISSTTNASMNGKLVIAAQNGRICQAKVFGDASGVLVSKIVIYQSAIVNNRSWVEVFCNFDGWSKNKVHIYGVALESATVTNQMSSVTFTNGVPSPITSGDSKWNGTIDNDLSVKQNKLTAGSNITISGNTISAKDTTYSFIPTNPTLAWNTAISIGTIGGVDFTVKLPTNPNTHQSIKSINTNNTTGQSFGNEPVAGSGTINLHKIAKTGSYKDLLNQPTIGNGQITITVNKTAYSFTTNQTGNTSMTIKIPITEASLDKNNKILTLTLA